MQLLGLKQVQRGHPGGLDMAQNILKLCDVFKMEVKYFRTQISMCTQDYLLKINFDRREKSLHTTMEEPIGIVNNSLGPR